MNEATNYYGPFNPTVRKYVEKWFEKHNFCADDISTLWAEILKSLSSSYKSPPDVAALEAAHKSMLSRDDRRADRQRYLPAPREEVDRGIALDFVASMLEAMVAGRNPRDDQKLREIVETVTGEGI
jgi:hypothetical protein